MLDQLLQWGYDASLPLDDFLNVEYHPLCYICGHWLEEGDIVLRILRTDIHKAEDALGSMLHEHHVMLVDLLE